MKKYGLFIIALTLVLSCNKGVKIDFSEQHIEASKATEVLINIPKAKGTKDVANLINNTLQNYIINQTNLTEDSLTKMSFEEALKLFDKEYLRFKEDVPDSNTTWEFLVDGEVTYRSPEIISIVITTYLDTGGAHGNTTVRFFNFNPETGKLLTKKELVGNLKGLSEVVKTNLVKELESNSEDGSMADFFFGEEFQLPETIGYSDEGLIILYNPYEIASYAQGIIEFSIPYEEVSSFLNIY